MHIKSFYNKKSRMIAERFLISRRHPQLILFYGVIILLFFPLKSNWNFPDVLNKAALATEGKANPSNSIYLNIAQASTQSPDLHGPLRVSTINPRYFTVDDRKAVYLSGSHIWNNFQDSDSDDTLPYPTDFSQWLDFLQENNQNFIRLWTWEQSIWVVESTTPYYFNPMPYERTGPGSSADGGAKFDLSRFNQGYFDRMRARIVEAGNREMYVSIMLFNGWSIEFPKSDNAEANPWQGHPFNSANNINGVDGDLNNDDSGSETHTMASAEITKIQEAYVRKVIDTVNDLDNVLYEISNESPADSSIWQYHMINYIKNYEASLPKQHPVGMTSEYPLGSNEELFNSPADWISPNNYEDPPSSDGRKVIIADTDHICGLCGDRVWVWKSFTKGLNLLFMDRYDDSYRIYGGGYDMNNPNDVDLRINLGYVRTYADRMNLLAMTPRDDLCSTSYCLANPVGNGAEYLVYLPLDENEVTLDLSNSPGSLLVEWFDPNNNTRLEGNMVQGGGLEDFTSPFPYDAVLYVYDSALTIPSPMPTDTLTPPDPPTPTGTPPSSSPATPSSPLSCFTTAILLVLLSIASTTILQHTRKSL